MKERRRKNYKNWSITEIQAFLNNPDWFLEEERVEIIFNSPYLKYRIYSSRRKAEKYIQDNGGYLVIRKHKTNPYIVTWIDKEMIGKELI